MTENDLGPGEDPSDAAYRAQVLAYIRAHEGTLRNPWVHYGGVPFEPGAEFPGWQGMGPQGPTSASGPYQWERKTWEQQAHKLGLTNFADMAQQNIAAWDLATTTYSQKTGRDLLEDAKKGTVNWQALAGQWSSLAKGTGRVSGGGSFTMLPLQLPQLPASAMSNFHYQQPDLIDFTAGQAIPSQPQTSPTEMPQTAFQNPDLGKLLTLALLTPHFQFTPVEYNPFAGEGHLTTSPVPIPKTPTPEVPVRGALGAVGPASPGPAEVARGFGIPRRFSEQESGAENYVLGPLMHPEG